MLVRGFLIAVSCVKSSRNPLNKWINQSVFVSNDGSNWDLFRLFLGQSILEI